MSVYGAESHYSEDPTTIEDVGPYVLGEVLGRGTFGTARVARLRSHGGCNDCDVACKIVPWRMNPVSARDDGDTYDDRCVDFEFTVLAALTAAKVPGVCKVFERIYSGLWQFIFMPLGVGRLSFLPTITADKPPHHAFRKVMWQFRNVLIAVRALHDLGIAHCDLKPDNIVIDKTGAPMIIDFGLSVLNPFDSLITSKGGSFPYASPENLHSPPGTFFDPKRDDIWALGIILGQMLGLAHPYADDEGHIDRARIANGAPTWRFPAWAQEFWLDDLIMRMCCRNPSGRPSLDMILSHPYICSDEPYRVSAEAHLHHPTSVRPDVWDLMTVLARHVAVCGPDPQPWWDKTRLSLPSHHWRTRWLKMVNAWRPTVHVCEQQNTQIDPRFYETGPPQQPLMLVPEPPRQDSHVRPMPPARPPRPEGPMWIPDSRIYHAAPPESALPIPPPGFPPRARSPAQTPAPIPPQGRPPVQRFHAFQYGAPPVHNMTAPGVHDADGGRPVAESRGMRRQDAPHAADARPRRGPS